MKILFSLLALLILTDCTTRFTAIKNENVPTQVDNKNENASHALATPNETAPGESSAMAEADAQNEKFRIAPESFEKFDFKNFSYLYQFEDNSKLLIALKNGWYEFGSDLFSFHNAYYVDFTGDKQEEAIVLLWHVSCGASCDGGAALVYIYILQQNRLKELWQYETGSVGYGCGLKSFTVKNRKITLELFDRCSAAQIPSNSGFKFSAKDLTSLTFSFNGSKFVQEKKEFMTMPERNVMNYKSEISISQD